MLAVTLLAAALLVAAPPAGAGELSGLFDFSVRIGERGITLGGRVDGPFGPTSGTVNGRVRDGGVAVDGWLDDRGKTWLFELDANARDGLRATVRRSPLRI